MLPGINFRKPPTARSLLHVVGWLTRVNVGGATRRGARDELVNSQCRMKEKLTDNNRSLAFSCDTQVPILAYES